MGNTFNLALYTSSASPDAATSAYTTSDEVSGTGYTAKGQALTNIRQLRLVGTNSTADLTISQTFSSSTITANGALIFNDSASGDPAVAVLYLWW